MSYGLLWIETLCAALLWVATGQALVARWRTRSEGALMAIVIAVPAIAFILLVTASTALKFALQLEGNWFAYTLSLLIAFLVGTFALQAIARRRLAPGGPPAVTAWSRGRLAAALAVVAAVTAMTLWNMDAYVRAEAANERTEAGAMLIAVAPPEVEDERNAAILYEKAFARLDAEARRNDPDAPLREESPNPTSPAVTELLARQATTLRQLRDATKLPGCRFEHDYAHPSFSMLLPEMNRARQAAYLLRLDARNAVATGRDRDAIEDANAIFRLSRGIGAVPTLVGGLVGMGIDVMGVRLVEEILPNLARGDDLAALNLGDAATLRRMLRRCLRGEEAFGTSVLCDLGTGSTTLQKLLAAPNERHTPRSDVSELPIVALLIRVFIVLPDLRSYRQYLESCQAQAAEPFHQTERAGSEQALLRAKHSGLLTSILMPALPRVFRVEAQDEALHAAGQVGVAVARYRADHHAFPPNLDALVPRYLDDVPLDPFDGQPLRARVSNDGEYVVYSVGPDLKDDRGATFDEKTSKGDLAFSVGTSANGAGPATAPATSPSAGQ